MRTLRGYQSTSSGPEFAYIPPEYEQVFTCVSAL